MLPFALLLVFAELPAGPALIQSLPADGAWVQFDVIIEIGGEEHRPGWRIQSVGRREYSGRPCRWIELEQTGDSRAYPPMVYRLLIAEDEFAPGRYPLAKPLRGWKKEGDGVAHEIADLEEGDPLLYRLQQGPLDNRRQLETVERIDWQRGRIEGKPIEGTTDFEFSGAQIRLHHHVVRHTDVPFGLVSGRHEFRLANNEEGLLGSVTVRLLDYGTDAQPRLPELVP